ncbi:MAG: allene oxide cyclase barrel-like domain-containing protein, partial [Nocardioidaceae bacterium]
ADDQGGVMISRTRTLAVALAVTTLAVTGAAHSAVASGGGHGDVLRFTSVQVAETELDLGAAGFSQGDQTVFSDDLRRGGEKIGTDAGVCTVARVAGADTELTCIATFRLPRGTITTQAMFAVAQLPRVDLAITGGTGAYSGASGHGRTVAGAVAPVVLHLQGGDD